MIPVDRALILERLEIRTESWVELAREFGHRFRRVIGRPSEITTAASHGHQRWTHGMKSARRAFKSRSIAGTVTIPAQPPIPARAPPHRAPT